MIEVGHGQAALAIAVAAACGALAGIFGQGQADASRETLQAQHVEADRKHERELAAAREAHLNEIIESERKRHDESIRGRDSHLAAFTARSIRLRNDLEAMLADSRAAADTCSGRTAAISADVAVLYGLLDQSAELLEAGQSEIGRLEGENSRLVKQVAGLIDQYRSEHPERVTVTGTKR